MAETVENVIDCKLFHESCFDLCSAKIFKTLKYTAKVYMFAHGIPLIIFKLKQLKVKPKETLYNLLISILKSMGFFSTYILSIRFFHCLYHYRLMGKVTGNLFI